MGRTTVKEIMNMLKDVPENSKLLLVRIIPLNHDRIPEATEFAAKLVFESDNGARTTVSMEYSK